MNICFSDFWGGFDPNDNFLIHYLRFLGDVNLTSIHDADVLIYSCFGENHQKVNRDKVKKIFYTGENIRPDFTRCDYSITFDFDDYNNRNIRIPLWYFYIDWNFIEKWNYYLIDLNEDKWFKKYKEKNFCCIFSNPVQNRMEMLSELSNYFELDKYGAPFNNYVLGGVEKKYEIISSYKSSMCFENSFHPGYVTEKLLHARTAGNLAIYWGHPDVKYDFNPEGFVNANDFSSFADCAKHIHEILNDECELQRIINSKIFSCNFFNFNESIKQIIF